jgi:hypothetical protein
MQRPFTFDWFSQGRSVGEHPAVVDIARRGLVKPFGAAFRDDVDDSRDAANGGVVERIQVGTLDTTRKLALFLGFVPCVQSDPAAEITLPRSIFDVFALAKDGVNPRLLDGQCFQLCSRLSCSSSILFGIGGRCSFHCLRCRGGDCRYD